MGFEDIGNMKPTGTSSGNAQIMVMLFTGLIGMGPGVVAEANESISSLKKLKARVSGGAQQDPRDNGLGSMTHNAGNLAVNPGYTLDATSEGTLAISICAYFQRLEPIVTDAVDQLDDIVAKLAVVAEKLCNKDLWQILFDQMGDSGDGMTLGLLALTGSGGLGGTTVQSP